MVYYMLPIYIEFNEYKGNSARIIFSLIGFYVFLIFSYLVDAG